MNRSERKSHRARLLEFAPFALPGDGWYGRSYGPEVLASMREVEPSLGPLGRLLAGEPLSNAESEVVAQARIVEHLARGGWLTRLINVTGPSRRLPSAFA